MDLWKLVSFVFNGVLMVVCYLFLQQNKELKHTINDMTIIRAVEPLKRGDRVESISLRLLDGTTGQLNFGDPTKKYLLFVLSTSCPHCENTLPLWSTLAKAHNDNCDVIGISVGKLA